MNNGIIQSANNCNEQAAVTKQELYDYKKRLNIAIQSAGICVFEVDIKKQLYTFFENSEAIFGVSGEQILQELRSFSELPPAEYQQKVTEYFVHPDDTEQVERAFASIFAGKSTSYEARMRASNSSYIWCKLDVTPMTEPDGTMKMIGIISDIQAIKEQIDSLTKETWLDSFTRLYSKNRFAQVCQRILCEAPTEPMALFIFDLDNFKAINDTLGHQVGDEVILSIADSLRSNIAKQHIVGRFGGDEFILLLRNTTAEEAVQAAQALLTTVDNDYQVTKSIGIALYPQSADNYEALLSRADEALYQAKRTKNTYAVSDTHC